MKYIKTCKTFSNVSLMAKPFAVSVLILLFVISNSIAQSKSLVNTGNSSHAKLGSVDMGAVQWTTGFWANRFQVCRDSMIPNLWHIYNDADISHAFKNFEIAARLDTGSFRGPSFHDGDYYKTLEAVAGMYAATKDKSLDILMDKAIAVIAKSQREDGYIYTAAMINQRKTGSANQFQDRLSFEAYNIGHLMTAACVHYRATGKSTLMDVAKKATDYLYNFYKKASPTLARNAICPSHYMGVVEMYRTTKDPRYLELAKNLIDIKGKIDDGTDDNQDRIPFRQQQNAMGHAVRANYLYAGVADVYAETGDTSLLNRLNVMWDDVVNRKMYITGGCGSLYDGVSPDGTSYNPANVQKTHQAYGRPYQLPNLTAHNETCANIGNVLWNWRMLLLTGDAKYADVMELALYNSVLSGISLNGKKFLYTNPLSVSADLPFRQRWAQGTYSHDGIEAEKLGELPAKQTWSRERVDYISLSNCCPPNVVRTVAEVSNYAYSISEKGLWFNLYGSNNLSTTLEDGSIIKIKQESGYPWDGRIMITVEEPSPEATFFVRIPGWAAGAKILLNGKPLSGAITAGSYAPVKKRWVKGDVVEVLLPMDVKLIAANPLVEETRSQVAIKRGPVVYCLESVDLPTGVKISDVVIPAKPKLTPTKLTIDNSPVMALQGKAGLAESIDWKNTLYREVSPTALKPIDIRLVPYYAWGNRGKTDMSVWMSFER